MKVLFKGWAGSSIPGAEVFFVGPLSRILLRRVPAGLARNL